VQIGDRIDREARGTQLINDRSGRLDITRHSLSMVNIAPLTVSDASWPAR
jgi:hypothetical protein